MKIPRQVQHSALALLSLCLFAVAIEGLSYCLLKLKTPHWRPQAVLPDEIWTFDHVKKHATFSGRTGDLARVIMAGNYEQRVPKDLPTQEDMKLFHERPEYVPSEKGRPLWFRPHMVSPNLNEKFVLKGAVSGKIKYNVHYTTDEFGRRLAHPEGKKNVLFLGCSFTFGQGVNDEETFPYLVGKKTGLRTYNAGIPGVSPTIILKRIREKNYPGPITNDETTVVLTIIPEHLIRTIGTVSLFANGFDPFIYYPYAYVENDQLVIRPSFSHDPTYGKHLLNAFAKTNFARASGLDFPWLGENQFQLFARIIREIESELRKNYPQVKHFAVSFFPTGNARENYRALRDHLIRENIRVFDFTLLNAAGLFGESFHIKYDGHPSPLTYELYSDLLVSELAKL